ncbi:MAG TPA: SMP-30/gluconolactonase/LRE family protein [Bryobacteraceae bacterium]|nr:SMP-30/gluconolactonase/LRE family protein [Bryobacteraceae bacterium]
MEIIADYHDLCGECPIWDPDARTLYWTDCEGFRFYKYLPATRHHEVIKTGLEINGYRVNRPGGFIITNNSGIWLWDGADKTTAIATEVDGAKCRMNDCISDPEGRLFAGSWFYNPDEKYPLGKLMRVDTNGHVSILDDGFHLANGLAFSLDYKTLYFTDTFVRRIYAYDYNRTTGAIRNRRVFIQVPKTEGMPDGLTSDSEGFLWSAQWYGSCVVRYDPDGKVERRLATGAKQTSCMGFGGPDLTDLFITTALRSVPTPAMPPGYDAKSGFFGGPLYHDRPGVRGRAEQKTNIRIGRSSLPSW